MTPGIPQVHLKSLLSKLEEVADITQTRFFTQSKDALFADILELRNIFSGYNARRINNNHFGNILSSLVSSVKRKFDSKAGSLVNHRN